MSSPDDLELAANRILPMSFEQIVSKTEDIGTDIYHASLWAKASRNANRSQTKATLLESSSADHQKISTFFSRSTLDKSSLIGAASEAGHRPAERRRRNFSGELFVDRGCPAPPRRARRSHPPAGATRRGGKTAKRLSRPAVRELRLGRGMKSCNTGNRAFKKRGVLRGEARGRRARYRAFTDPCGERNRTKSFVF